MGLLSNPSNKSLSPLLVKFVKIQTFLSVSFYLGSIIWLICLAYRPYNAGTYFSENALLPGLVQPNYKDNSLTDKYLSALKAESERYPNGMPHVFLAAQLKQLGLDTYTHNFSLRYPLKKNQIYTGKNVYGILRGSRTASAESLVITTPYRPPDSTFTATNTGIAIMLSLAASFRKAPYWARDIIFLITEHEQLGIEAWLEAYHSTLVGSNVLSFGQLDARAGAIQAAVNLEIPTEKLSHIDVRMEGLNGQLPNLDLVNLAYKICQQERFITTLKDREDHRDPFSIDGWIYSAKTLLTMLASQATGVPTGNHGLFHRFGIEAVTLAGSLKPGSYGRSTLSFARALEGIIRSLNNLQERFHQSFFFYLMPATDRYISIGVYTPPFGLLIGAMLLHALALYSAREENSRGKLWKWKNLIPLLLLALASGFIFHNAPNFLMQQSYFWDIQLSTEHIMFGGYCVMGFIHCIIFAVLSHRFIVQQNLCAECVLCAIQLLMGTLLFSTSMGNISLALLASIFIIPVMSMAKPASKRIWNWLRMLLVLLIHPLSMLFLATLVDTYRTFPEEIEDPLNFLNKSIVASQRTLVYAIVDEFIYGNWIFSLATSIYLPFWSIAWANLFNVY